MSEVDGPSIDQGFILDTAEWFGLDDEIQLYHVAVHDDGYLAFYLRDEVSNQVRALLAEYGLEIWSDVPLVDKGYPRDAEGIKIEMSPPARDIWRYFELILTHPNVTSSMTTKDYRADRLTLPPIRHDGIEDVVTYLVSPNGHEIFTLTRQNTIGGHFEEALHFIRTSDQKFLIFRTPNQGGHGHWENQPTVLLSRASDYIIEYRKALEQTPPNIGPVRRWARSLMAMFNS